MQPSYHLNTTTCFLATVEAAQFDHAPAKGQCLNEGCGIKGEDITPMRGDGDEKHARRAYFVN
jgi:hypothetical protein